MRVWDLGGKSRGWVGGDEEGGDAGSEADDRAGGDGGVISLMVAGEVMAATQARDEAALQPVRRGADRGIEGGSNGCWPG